MSEDIRPEPGDEVVARHRGATVGVIFALIVLLGGFVVWQRKDSPFIARFLGIHTATSTQQQVQLVGMATYTCNNGKTISAQFFDIPTPPATTPGMPPTPTGRVGLTLSDGRTLSVLQTISASGIRYANANETFIFWSKGNTAFIQEGMNQEQTYQNCVSGDTVPGASTLPEGDVMPDSGVLNQ